MLLHLSGTLHCSINHTRPEYISKHSVSGQGKEQVPQHKVGLNSRLSIEKSALFTACLPVLVAHQRDMPLFTEEHTEIFLWLHKNTGSAAISRLRER